MTGLTDRSFLVTGGARGVGLATARLLLAEGASVAICDAGASIDGTSHDPSVVKAAKVEIASDRLIALPCDVTNEEDVHRAVFTCMESLGRLDGVFHCAGVRTNSSLATLTLDELSRQLDVSLRAAFHLTQAAVPILERNENGGSLLMAVGSEAFFGAQRQAAEAAASGALVGWVRSAAVELRRRGIRINAIVPTARTRLTEDTALFRGIAHHSLRADYVAPVAAFLLSDLAARITGEAVGVAGARTYVIRSRESIGVLNEERPFTVLEAAKRWRDIARG